MGPTTPAGAGVRSPADWTDPDGAARPVFLIREPQAAVKPLSAWQAAAAAHGAGTLRPPGRPVPSPRPLAVTASGNTADPNQSRRRRGGHFFTVTVAAAAGQRARAAAEAYTETREPDRPVRVSPALVTTTAIPCARLLPSGSRATAATSDVSPRVPAQRKFQIALAPGSFCEFCHREARGLGPAVREPRGEFHISVASESAYAKCRLSDDRRPRRTKPRECLDRAGGRGDNSCHGPPERVLRKHLLELPRCAERRMQHSQRYALLAPRPLGQQTRTVAPTELRSQVPRLSGEDRPDGPAQARALQDKPGHNAPAGPRRRSPTTSHTATMKTRPALQRCHRQELKAGSSGAANRPLACSPPPACPVPAAESPTAHAAQAPEPLERRLLVPRDRWPMRLRQNGHCLGVAVAKPLTVATTPRRDPGVFTAVLPYGSTVGEPLTSSVIVLNDARRNPDHRTAAQPWRELLGANPDKAPCGAKCVCVEEQQGGDCCYCSSHEIAEERLPAAAWVYRTPPTDDNIHVEILNPTAVTAPDLRPHGPRAIRPFPTAMAQILRLINQPALRGEPYTEPAKPCGQIKERQT
ncbi:unnamed protein product [Lampetra fluviatilis]